MNKPLVLRLFFAVVKELIEEAQKVVMSRCNSFWMAADIRVCKLRNKFEFMWQM
jgi:hypothetical protein